MNFEDRFDTYINQIFGDVSVREIIEKVYQNNLKFSFIAFNYVNPSKCKYAYMLEGYNKDWVYTSSDNRIAEYSNLPKGNYIFKVKASNEDGVWNN